VTATKAPIFTFLFCLGLLSFATAQPVSETMPLRPNQLKNYAKNAERIGDIYTAIDYYDKYRQFHPENHKISFKMGMLYYKARDYGSALVYFEKAYTDDPAKQALALYYQGLMQKMLGQYEPATALFAQFKKEYRGNSDTKYYTKLMKNEVAGIVMAKTMIDTPQNIVVTHLDTSINKAHVELNPIPISATTFIYGSLPSDSIQYFPIEDDSIKPPVRKFFVAEKKDNVWLKKSEFEGPFNQDDVHTANGAFSPDGKRFFFTRYSTNWKYQVIGQIYMSTKTNGQWQEPELLNDMVNMSNYTSTQPTVGTESKRGYEVLYFVSNRPGGKGGTDIWYTYYDARKDVWKEPKNAGSKVNTIQDEITPFYDMDTRSLYFSSNGWPSIGGMDINRTTGEMRKWVPPSNIGYPLNTSVDELYYVVGEDKERGFIVSNRKGGVALKHPTCCDDIYEFYYSDYIHIGLEGFVVEVADSVQDLNSMVTNIEIADKDKMPLIDSSIVSLYLIDPETGDDIYIKSDTTGTDGEYFFNVEVDNDYKVVVERDGYFTSSATLTTRGIIKADTLLQPLAINKYGLSPIVVKNIYYPFDKHFLTDEAKLTIDTTIYEIMLENPTLIAEISSHTDSKGTYRYNEGLSQKRAESVVKYLVEKGIAKERMDPKGYGENQPIATNENEDGSDNPEGRQKNRRTEFKVIGVLDKYSEILYED
jgi:outer membrane protein OmpA-like peptidoglycan-associated protein/tetratricopeptide (TPR) repeat protein